MCVAVMDKVFKFIRIAAVIISEVSFGILLDDFFLSIFLGHHHDFIISSLLLRLALVRVLVVVAILILSLINFGCCRLRLGLCLSDRYIDSRHVIIIETAVIELSPKGISSRFVSIIIAFPGDRLLDCILGILISYATSRVFSRSDRLQNDGQFGRQTDIVLRRTVIDFVFSLNTADRLDISRRCSTSNQRIERNHGECYNDHHNLCENPVSQAVAMTCFAIPLFHEFLLLAFPPQRLHNNGLLYL